MKLEDIGPEYDQDDSSQLSQVPFMATSSVTVWLLHWVSALLVLFLLATSLTSVVGLTTRLFPGAWMDWHLSVGVALLAMTVIRIKTSQPWKGFAFSWRGPQATKSFLFFVVLFVLLSGLAIFQKPPFGPSGVLFGLFPMPTLIRLNHSIHYVIIDLHIAASCVIALLLIVHVLAGLRRLPASRKTAFVLMLWPWRKSRQM